MKIINSKSLSKTLDNLNQLLFYNEKFSDKERTEAAGWIAGRQGLKGSYGNILFAPTENDFKGIKLFTGDKLTSKASIAHILGEESLRALQILNPKNKGVNKTILEAKTGLNKILKNNYYLGNPFGTFCCGKCTAALWRNLSAEGATKNNNFFENGIKYLKSLRDGKGKWKRFPFFYTLLALTDINLPSAEEELIYASGICKKYLNRKITDDVYVKRKREIAERVLKLI